MEFVILFPVVITLFIAAFETGMILSRQVLLERSLDEAVRSFAAGAHDHRSGYRGPRGS